MLKNEGHFSKKDSFNPADSPCAIARRYPQWPFGIHTHDFCEVVVIVKGCGKHITALEKYPIEKGDVFVVTAGSPHGYDELDDCHLINLYYDQNQLNIPSQDLLSLAGYRALFALEPIYRKQHRFDSRLRLEPVELTHVLSLIDSLDDELTRQQNGFRFMAGAIFMLIAGYISRCYEKSQRSSSVMLLDIGRAVCYLETQYAAPISVCELARMANMSERNFSRVFHKLTGHTPIGYLLRQRIQKAAELLRLNGKTISEVAAEVGFEGSSYFTRQFTGIMHMTPRQYRKTALSAQ